MKTIITDNWKLRHAPLEWDAAYAPSILSQDAEWFSVDLPCDVHVPLIEAGLIPEPLEGQNTEAARWVEERSWWFLRTFELDDTLDRAERVEISADGLDSEADLFLNGFHLGHHRSSFYPFVTEVSSLLKPGKNSLLVRVTCGLEHVRDLDIAPFRRCISGGGRRGDKRRVFVRKPQFVFGWDWSPRLATCAIAGEVALIAHSTARIVDISVTTTAVALPGETGGAGDRKDRADLHIAVELENLSPISTREVELKVRMKSGSQEALVVERRLDLQSGLNHLDISTGLESARLWWPNGMGEQHLYTVEASLSVSGTVVDRYEPFSFGVRTIELVQEPVQSDGNAAGTPSATRPDPNAQVDERGRSFFLRVNGVETFAKGANWIPADCLYARVTDEKYRLLVGEARDAGFTMFRIWGGGIYERDVFYRLCDENGILLWHDLMFAGGLYPDHLPWFRAEVERELDHQTRRLRNHACIALWCGNNEIHWFADFRYTGENTPPFLGGFDIYNSLMPRIVRHNCPHIPYWRSSPYGGKNPGGPGAGDEHHWLMCTMSKDPNKRISPEEYDKSTAKFVSEFGILGAPVSESIRAYLGDAPFDRTHDVWRLHTNSIGTARQAVDDGIRVHFTEPDGLGNEEYVLYAGMFQGLMLGYALESFRSQLHCNGGLFWMYNDAWGEIGWSAVDYYGRRKPAYYSVRRAFAPIRLIARERDNAVQVVGVNDTAGDAHLKLEYGYVPFDGSPATTNRRDVLLPSRTRTTALVVDKPSGDYKNGCFAVWPIEHASTPTSPTPMPLPAALLAGRYRDLKIPPAEPVVDVTREEADGILLTVHSPTFAPGVHFPAIETARMSDCYFDLLPNETRTVHVTATPAGVNGDEITVRCIGLGPELEER